MTLEVVAIEFKVNKKTYIMDTYRRHVLFKDSKNNVLDLQCNAKIKVGDKLRLPHYQVFKNTKFVEYEVEWYKNNICDVRIENFVINK